MKRIVAVCVVFCAALAGPVAAQDVPLRTIIVTGQAERKIVPDEAHVMVNLNSLNLQLAAAKAENDTKLKELLKIVDKAGIDSKKVATQSATTQPMYDYQTNKRVFRGYRVQTLLNITVAPIDKVGELMEKISNAGFEKNASTEWGELMSVGYGFAEPRKISDELLVEAIKNARSKAEAMAKAADADVARVQSINENTAPDFNMPMPMMARGMMSAVAEQSDAPVAPPAGERTVKASVNVTFELK